MKYLLGIDFGGGSAKATLLSTNGQIVAEASAEYPTYHPETGYCEQKPSDWGKALSDTVRRLLSDFSADPADILAIAIDSATHTAVLCDSAATPLRSAIHWTDSRAVKQSSFLRKAYGDRIFALSYHKPDTIWTLPQLLWVKENQPEVFEKIGMLFFEKDYIRYLLTGVFCTDFIEAQGSMLWDMEKKAWSSELCDMIGLPESCLPPVKAPTDMIGAVTNDGAQMTGLCVGTPVITGTTDTVLEVFAAGAVEKRRHYCEACNGRQNLCNYRQGIFRP